MTGEKTLINYYRNLSLELLEKYIDDELSLIYEYSCNFDESKDKLLKVASKYLKQLGALNLLEEYKNKIYS